MKNKNDELINLYRVMLTIRRFEERVLIDYHSGTIPGLVHSYIGQEAVAAGVCTNLRRDDRIISNHRGHGHCIAKGADINRMMAEIYGRKTGYCKGKGGSMHIADFGIGMLGANGIVAGGLPIATGAALAAQLEGGDKVVVLFFGDGATNEGEFHEVLNLASIWKLPIIKDKTKLNVLVALTPLFHGRGPHHFNQRYVWSYKGIFVSTDPVAIDTMGLHLLKTKRRQYFGRERALYVPGTHIAAADTMHGLGVGDLNRIDLVKLGWDQEALI